MTCNASLITYLVYYNVGKVTFGKGTIECPGMPKLEKVLYVIGLKANLLDTG